MTDKYIVVITTLLLYVSALQFQTDREIQKNDGLYREKPTISEKMHCVLFVVNADMLDKGRENSTLKNIQHYLADNGNEWTVYV